MKLNTKRTILSAAGLLLSARNTLAAATNTSSTDIVGNLGVFSTFAGTILMYAKYVAFFAAIIAILFMFATGALAKTYRKAENAINAQENVKKCLIECILVIVAFIVLFDLVIPTINGFIPTV
jgi:succinyl-CoA synthetase beta subunit